MFKFSRILISFLLLITANAFSQFSLYTYVPDDNFEQYLESNGYGNGILYDDSVSTILISSVEELNINFLNISDLTGIENFSSIEELECEYNNLTQLDLSNNYSLEELKCSGNQISSLLINNLFSLKEIDCSNNSLTTLDFISLNNLEELDCSFNQIINLDLSGCSAIEKIYCNNNSLQCLNLKNGNISNISDLVAIGNINLTCIDVDNPSYATYNWNVNNGFYFDNAVSFSNYCLGECNSTNVDSTATCDSIIFVYDTVTINDTLIFYSDTTTFYDSVIVCDSIIVSYDTLLHYDTIVYRDTIVYHDTNYVSVGVTDTLYMNVSFNSSSSGSSFTTFKIFPNPVSDVLNINNGDYTSISNYELKISNGLGQSVFSSLINIPQFQIPVSIIGSPGLYFIQVFDNLGGLVVTKQLLIN